MTAALPDPPNAQSHSGEVLERELEHSLRRLLREEVPSATDPLDAQIGAG
jgi:hypothetical protein